MLVKKQAKFSCAIAILSVMVVTITGDKFAVDRFVRNLAAEKRKCVRKGASKLTGHCDLGH
jgi:hypothetical protein